MDDWSDFPEAEDDDPWAAFPEVSPAKGKRGQKRRKGTKSAKGAILEGTMLGAPLAADGDTIRADQGRVRLAGVDAPEAAQVGWDRAGQPVPIGSQAKGALADFLDQGPAVTGNAFGSSYGRTVAPVTVRNDDAGRTLIRYGNAFAAPDYLAFDAPRARQYQQDERLARMNGLGVHDSFTRSPAEFRADPNYVPSGETVAQFFDTPTPLQGLPPEKEQKYLHLLANASPEAILSFVQGEGGSMREKELRQWVQWRDDERKAGRNVPVEAIYERGPQITIDAGDGMGGAIVRKGASGFLAGGLDELGAVVDTLGGTPGRESLWNSDRRLADIWANNQRQNSAILSFDQEAHPVASTAAEIGGGLLGGFVIPYGQGARTVAELAKVGAVYGGATGFLGTDGTVADRALGGVKGTLAGALVTPALGKAIEAVPAVVAAGRKLVGRGAAEAAGDASGGVGARAALDEAPAADAGDDWSAFPVDEAETEVDALLRSGAGVATVNSVLKQQGREPIPLAEFEKRRAIAMEAAPEESISAAAPRERDFIDLSVTGRARPMADDYTTAERLAAAERVGPDDVLPMVENAAVSPEGPFAPPEGYGDASREAIRRVGNLEVSKLDSPQDIARALKTSHGAIGGFDAATRGKVTHAETERLAADLGMTADGLLSRRKGQAFNAEEALAARQVLAKSGNELVNAARAITKRDDPGEELLADFRRKWVRHVAIQEQVSGMTAEAGRALQQFRQAADSRAVRSEVLNAIVRGAGGKSNLQDAANTLLEAVELGPGRFNVLAAQAAKPKWKDKIGELYINFLLSNPPTHVVNMVSNTLTSMAQIPEHATAAVIGAGRKAVLGKAAQERITGSEVGARTFGLVQGAKEGLGLFAKALRTGEADDFVSKVEGDEFKAISGLRGEVIRVPTRLLTAEDQIFKGIARRMELNAQAVRIANREGHKGEARAARIAELVANPTDDMLARAMEYGRYLTFQRQLGDFGQGIQRITGSNLLAKVVVPFTRTPINLMKFATERSPAAPLLKEWRADFIAGGERRDLAISKALLGTGLATIIYQAALDGRITGAVPPDPAKAKLLYADGWQPYSVRIGDRYVSYSRLDPFSTTIGVAADMATLPSGLSDRQREDQGTMLVASLMGNLASKTWLSGVSSFTEALADPGRAAESWWQRTVSAFAVPAGVAGAARAIDPVARKRESVGDAIKARVPGLSDNLLPRRDVFGEVVPLDSLGPDFLSPFWQTKAKNDPVVAEMLRIEKGVSAPGKQYTEDGERLDYSPEKYDRYHEIAGRLTYNALLGLIGSPSYRGMDDDARRKSAKRVIAKARKDARSVLDDPDYPLPDRGAAQPAGEGEWKSFPAASGEEEPDPWSAFPIADKRDVQAELSQAIPGIRFTSGYRDPAYNASLRARGYHPANDSEHLDGAALDMLPPPGKSLGWLRAQVALYDPKARLKVHDGHVHGGFDGYFSAPKLGGMAAR